MSRKLLFIALMAALVSAVFVFCQKKMFGHIEVEGRVLHYFSKKPLSGIHVTLLADDYQSAKSLDSDITFDEAVTGENGRFTLKSRPSKGHEYYVSIEDMPYPIKHEVSIKKGQNDVGDFLSGREDFYCRVTITSTSTNCFFFCHPKSDEETRFEAGTNTSFLVKNTYNSEQFNGNFNVTYRIDGCETKRNPFATFHQNDFPLTSKDTLHLEISY